MQIRRLEFVLADPRLFETLCLELHNPLAEKYLINVSYCPHPSLVDLFLYKLCAEVSNVFSITDNILFDDHNFDILSINELESLQKFALGLEIQLSNLHIPTRICSITRSLIDLFLLMRKSLMENLLTFFSILIMI